VHIRSLHTTERANKKTHCCAGPAILRLDVPQELLLLIEPSDMFGAGKYTPIKVQIAWEVLAGCHLFPFCERRACSAFARQRACISSMTRESFGFALKGSICCVAVFFMVFLSFVIRIYI
jgi:hypothetical protein